MINKERLALGIQALESGEFRQGRGSLGRPSEDGDRYCCLGVLTEVAMRNGCPVTKDFEPYSHVFRYDGNTALLPPLVADWYGFAHNNPCLTGTEEDLTQEWAAANWNDSVFDPKDFAWIAAAFRRTYLDAS